MAKMAKMWISWKMGISWKTPKYTIFQKWVKTPKWPKMGYFGNTPKIGIFTAIAIDDHHTLYRDKILENTPGVCFIYFFIVLFFIRFKVIS